MGVIRPYYLILEFKFNQNFLYVYVHVCNVCVDVCEWRLETDLSVFPNNSPTYYHYCYDCHNYYFEMGSFTVPGLQIWLDC